MTEFFEDRIVVDDLFRNAVITRWTARGKFRLSAHILLRFLNTLHLFMFLGDLLALRAG